MARTLKTEYHSPDGWHISKRLERKARQPQAPRKAFEADLALDEEEVA